MQLNTEKTLDVERIKYTGTPVLCVLGCLMNDLGKRIKQEMVEWISEKYDIVAVNQEYPGKMFEFPGLAMAQTASITLHKPVLYLHTKGAFNTNTIYSQENVRKLWKREFIDNYDYYFGKVSGSGAAVACPFTGSFNRTTWMNGFVANEAAWSSIPRFESSYDRFPYEHTFIHAGIPVYGRIMNNVNFWPSRESQKMVNFINSI